MQDLRCAIVPGESSVADSSPYRHPAHVHTLGERVRTERKRAGMTQMDLATALRAEGDEGIDSTAISNMERGVTMSPGIERVVKLAKLFRVSADYLLGLSDQREAEWARTPAVPAEGEAWTAGMWPERRQGGRRASDEPPAEQGSSAGQ